LDSSDDRRLSVSVVDVFSGHEAEFLTLATHFEALLLRKDYGRAEMIRDEAHPLRFYSVRYWTGAAASMRSSRRCGAIVMPASAARSTIPGSSRAPSPQMISARRPSSAAKATPAARSCCRTRAQTSWVTTIGLALIAFWYVIAGYIQDRRGPRPVAVAGGLLFSLGFLLASFTTSLTWFYLTAGVIAGTGSGFGYAIPTSVGSKWFPDKRGLVIGLMVGGYGAGSGVFGPIALSLIERVGWRSTFQILSIIFLAMTMTGAYLLRNPPAKADVWKDLQKVMVELGLQLPKKSKS